MNDLVRVHSPSKIDTSSIHQIAGFSNRMLLANRFPIPIDRESNNLK
jgi:hypothetical protein